jgi:hypothetical protein
MNNIDRVNLRELSGFVGVTEQRVLQLVQKGVFIRGDDKLVNLRESIQNYIKYKVDGGKVAISDEESGLSFATFAERDKYYQSEDRRISLKEKTGELFQKDDVTEKIFALVELIRDSFLILPDVLEREASLNVKQLKAVQKFVDRKLQSLESESGKL